MLGEGGTPLSDLEDAARCFLQRGQRGIDLKRFRAVIDALEGDFAFEARHVQETGAHLAEGNATVVTWISRLCGMSATSAADRLCVGTQLEALPKVAAALRSGEIGYQSASLLCHLRDQLGEKRELFDEDEMLELARRHSVFNLRQLCRYARHVADPDGFFNEAEADYSRRELHISQMPDGMHADLPNLVLLCFFHHRLVHEGGWQVVKAGREFRFVPPERVVMRRARGPGLRWAA